MGTEGEWESKPRHAENQLLADCKSGKGKIYQEQLVIKIIISLMNHGVFLKIICLD